MTASPQAHSQPRRLTLDERRYYREWCIVALLGLATLTLFTLMQWGQAVGFVLYDQFQRWWPAEPGNEVVVIEIDDRTLDRRGGWPIRRTVYAELLRKLADTHNHPRAIGIDILFPDARADDAVLAEQMRRHQVFLATEQPRHVVKPSPDKYPISPLLAEAAQGLAHVNLSFEKDGSIRGARLIEHGLPQLAAAMAGISGQEVSHGASYRRLHLVHPQVGFPSVSMVDVLSGQVPLEFFKDKYVLIGATAPSLGDHFPTLYSGLQQAGTPGVMLHANLLSNLLHQQLIVPLSMGHQVALAGLVLFFAMVAVLVLSPLAELTVNLGIAACTLALSFALLVFSHRWFDPGLCVIAIALIKPAWVWRRNEMIVTYMGERTAALENNLRPRRKLGLGLGLRHFTSDTLLQYSRMLDKAIGMVSNRLVFLQRLVEQVPVAMLVSDEQGGIMLANPGMAQIFPAELVAHGQPLRALLAYLGLPAGNLEMLAAKDQLVTLEHPRMGEQHFILRMAAIDEGGDAPLWVLSLTDVSEMRQFQAQREQTLQLLSHDMRTPLAAIIALNRQNHVAAPASSVSDDIHRHARTLLDMMNDFIFSIQALAPRYKREESLMDVLLDDAKHQVKNLALGKKMPVLVEQDDEPVFVMVDQRLFIRVLVNLLVNAVRYGQQGTPIRIAIVVDRQSPQGAMVRCTITNTVGVADPLAMPETEKSFGLGLDFVKTVMHKHDGDVRMRISSVPGGTAAVELTLPQAL